MSFLKQLPPTDTHPLRFIDEFLKPYKLLFLEFESFVKCDVISMIEWGWGYIFGYAGLDVGHGGVGWVMEGWGGSC